MATAIPSITDEFKSLNDVGWYGSAFFLTIASFQAFWGKLYKFFPLKTSYLVAIAVFEVGSLICGVARNSVRPPLSLSLLREPNADFRES